MCTVSYDAFSRTHPYTRTRIHTQWGSIAQALHMLEEDGDQDELEEVDREVLGLMHSFQSNAHLLG